jgi:hypothetical protein
LAGYLAVAANNSKAAAAQTKAPAVSPSELPGLFLFVNVASSDSRNAKSLALLSPLGRS